MSDTPNPTPFFSAITAARLCPDRVRTLADSLSQQIWTDWELVVSVDDPEPTAAAVYLASLRDDPRVRLAPRTRRATGPGGARNDALDASRGQYIVLLDPDDALRDDYLQRFALHFHSYPDSRAALAPTRVVTANAGGESSMLFCPLADAAGEVDIDTYSQLLAPSHVVCRRDAHIACPEECPAEDVVRDALLVAAERSVPVLDTEYISQSLGGITERETRADCLRIAAVWPQISTLFVLRAASMSMYDAQRADHEDWFSFWARRRDDLPQVEHIESTSEMHTWPRKTGTTH